MAHRLGLGREALSQFERGVRIVNVAGRCAVRCRRGGRAGHVGLMMMLIPAWLPPFETNAAGFKLLTIWNVISESAVWFVLNPALVQPALV